MSTPYYEWIHVLRQLTATAEAAQAYQDVRYHFTSAVSRLLTESLPPRGHDQVLYAVWLLGHQAPIYLGSTTKARRRLWDLPIGESHHLPNTFPPEIWQRVQVLFWPKVLEDAQFSIPSLARSASSLLHLPEDRGVAELGLGFEHQFQAQYLPRFNSRKKRRDGTWDEIVFAASTGRPARLRPLLIKAHTCLDEAWRTLLSVPATSEVVLTAQGVVVHPQILFMQAPQHTT